MKSKLIGTIEALTKLLVIFNELDDDELSDFADHLNGCQLVADLLLGRLAKLEQIVRYDRGHHGS
jgi:hypothetical protein